MLIVGRTWQELDVLFLAISKTIKNNTMVFYVHNLAYEFQYLKGLYHFESKGKRGDTVFMMDDRTPLKCSIYGNIELRCSRRLTNMSLKAFTNEMDVEHKKLDGEEFDYSEVRYPWTVLTPKQLQYCYNDVLGLVEALKVKFSITGDTLATVPYTSTGYVRRDAKAVTRSIGRVLSKLYPSVEVYEELRKAFRGGNTHANRYNSNILLTGVASYDRSSSYPDVMVNCQYPMGEFKEIPDIVMDPVKGYAYIYEIDMYDVSIKEHVPVPYICGNNYTIIDGAIYDNGRVLKAKHIHVTITDVDLSIIKSQYNYTYKIMRAYRSRYGYLPECIRGLVREYYRKKTELKNVDGKELEYSLAKAQLNSIYGMMAQDPGKKRVLFDGIQAQDSDDDIEDILGTGGFHLPYQWGVWVSAWGRYRLQEGIDLTTVVDGEYVDDCMVYCDTDSCKFINNKTTDDAFSIYNEKRKEDSIKNGAYATDPNGVTHYMGVYECETDKEPGKCYKYFKTMGAKRYAYEDRKGLHITIAGVNKVTGAKELGTIENFRDGYIFENAGKTSATYVDVPDVEFIEKEGKKIRLTPYIIIEDSTYKLALTDEYRNLLSYLSI